MTALSDTPADHGRDAAGAAAGSRSHLVVFHGDAPLESDAPLVLVHGNCQAESLRIVLGGEDVATLRLPPVHELTRGDLPRLRRWLRRASVLVSQPVRPDYRDLPVGTRQLASCLRRDARVVLVPVVRFTGLHPTQAIVRPPSDTSLVPPVVPYHDLRVLGAAAGLRVPDPTPDAVRAIADRSLAALRAREGTHGTVPISDAFTHPRFEDLRTINHPGNGVFATLARRVRARLGLDEAVHDPGRPLLDGIHAPRDPAVIEAFGLADAPREDWIVAGRPVPRDVWEPAHRAFYAEHPDAVESGLARHAETLQLLGAR